MASFTHRSVCPKLLDCIGQRPPSMKACVLAYGLVLHVLVWFFFTQHKSDCVSMPSLRGAASSLN